MLTNYTDIHALIACYEAKFSLLLIISQSKLGATQVMNAGLYSSIRLSGLFATDLDLGLGKYTITGLPDLEENATNFVFRYRQPAGH